MDFLTFFAYLHYHPSISWMMFGALLLIFEVMLVPGIGVFFGGLGAITLGGSLALGIVDNGSSFYLQVALFFILTGFWTSVLWKPFQRLRRKKSTYHNIIGTRATVNEHGLVKGKTGQAKWSGAFMHARILDTSSVDKIAGDTEVWIHGLDGSVLLVDNVPYEPLVE